MLPLALNVTEMLWLL